MTAKEYLKQIGRLSSFIESKKERLTVLREMAASTGSSAMDGLPRNPGPAQSKMADAISKAIDLEREIARDEERLQQKKVFLLDLIGQIDNGEYQTVLIGRYFKNQTFDDIAAKLFYSERWVFELHGRALAELNRLLADKSDPP